jgi:hypothetical protein
MSFSEIIISGAIVAFIAAMTFACMPDDNSGRYHIDCKLPNGDISYVGDTMSKIRYMNDNRIEFTDAETGLETTVQGFCTVTEKEDV